MTTRSQTLISSRAVCYWILLGVFLLFVQVILGGITRLTGSGLSITEWNLVTGTLPPRSLLEWTAAFDKYRQTPQFRLLHADFTLADFQFIFFWEWFHRLWARLIGVVFLIGFAWLVWKKRIRQEMFKPLLLLFLLGALQGAVGWIMVISGLTGTAMYVEPTRLALHFIFGLGLICYTWWFALMLFVPAGKLVENKGLRNWTKIILLVLLVQLLFGALMAGYKAAASAPTWPTLNGYWIPPSVFTDSGSRMNFMANKITVQFIHRCLAYLLLIFSICWSLRAYRLFSVSEYLHKTRWLPLLMVSIQMMLGITALAASPGIVPNRWGLFEWIALMHQVNGMLFLLTMIFMLYLVRVEKR